MESNEKPIRDENGRLLPGSPSANPEGKNGHKVGWQPYGIRSAYLLGKYTPQEIKEIVTDTSKQVGISTYDLIILTHIAGTMGGDDRRLEREQLIDRIEGKATQPVKFSGDKDNPLNQVVTLKIDGIPTPALIPKAE